MISARTGDILESRMQTITNTVNCVGVMGKGLALEFKRHFPDMFRDYAERCRKDAVVPGKPYTYRNMLGVSILNFPTNAIGGRLRASRMPVNLTPSAQSLFHPAINLPHAAAGTR